MSEIRRFFFDDGSSRKRWQVQVKWKSQIVRYGRLSGSLRESKKSFKTPAEAAEKTEKLIESKKRNGYIEINASRLEFVRSTRTKAATEKQIRALERVLGCSLPDEYRYFLRTNNGGRPNTAYINVPGIPHVESVGVGTFFNLHASQPTADELLHQFGLFGSILPKGHLPIARDSDVFTLSLKAKYFGCVYWWDHEADMLEDNERFVESDGYLLAGSFDEFLTRIAVFHGDDEEGFTAPSAKSHSSTKRPKASIKQLLRLMNHDHTPEKIKEIEQVVKELGDLSGIRDGEWPLNNITSVRLLRCLLKAGLNPEITDSDNRTLLWQCASSAQCIDLLLEFGVDIERRSGDFLETALLRAIFVQSISGVERLLHAGAKPPFGSLRTNTGHLNSKLAKIVDDARARWKRKREKKKAARKK